DPGVADGEAHVLASPDRATHETLILGEVRVAGLDPQHAAVRHRIPRVGREIEENLLRGKDIGAHFGELVYPDITISTSAGRMRRKKPDRSEISPPKLTGWRSSLERRAKPSSSFTITRPRRAADITSRRSAWASAWTGGSTFATSWAFARMMVSRLLKSCAMPPVSWPIASIF